MKIKKILVVEDESIVAKDLQTRLRKLGYDVSNVVSSGEEAISKAAEISPDLVLMDIRIKGNMDGVEAAREIRARFGFPVIYLTANIDDNTLARAKQTEPSSYLLKPFKERELYIAIEIALDRYIRERQLKENEKLLDALLKHTNYGVIASDVEELITFMNPVAELLTGWDQAEAAGRNLTEIFNIAHEETRIPVESPVTQALRSGLTVGLPEKTVLVTRTGLVIPVDDSAAPIRDSLGNITGAVLVFKEITERKRLK
ncbi:MAG: response regulator [Chroococcidiopsidaceae cyanobacterium CP_BM_RX_35]|nr:response regulator [Chroococcidiopsidaceae cyanobacterium CP_BM_RX_35]